MAELFDNGRPNSQHLTEVMGLAPPALFVAFAQRVFDYAGGDAHAAVNLYSRLTGLAHPQLLTLYDNTPRELYAIGDTGSDGGHVGFIVHAPELGHDDAPWAEFIPGDNDLASLGNGTRDWLERLCSYRLANVPKLWQTVDDLSEVFGLQPDVTKGLLFGSHGQFC